MKLLEMFDSSEVKKQTKKHSIGLMVDLTLHKKRLVNSKTPIEIIENETQMEEKKIFIWEKNF